MTREALDGPVPPLLPPVKRNGCMQRIVPKASVVRTEFILPVSLSSLRSSSLELPRTAHISCVRAPEKLPMTACDMLDAGNSVKLHKWTMADGSWMKGQYQYKKDARLSQEPADHTSQRYAKKQEAVVRNYVRDGSAPTRCGIITVQLWRACYDAVLILSELNALRS